MRAVECERLIFDGADMAATNEALLEKAACYSRLGRYSDATATLQRIRMFALTEEERTDVMYRQELYHYMGGEFLQAATVADNLEPCSRDILLLHALVLAHAGRYDESQIMAARCISWDGPSPYLDELLALYRQRPLERKGATTLALSLLPPLGHFYNDAYDEGLLSGGLNAAALAFMVGNLVGGYWITGLLGGAIALNYTYMGNIERCQELSEINNNNSKIEFGERLRELLGRALSE